MSSNAAGPLPAFSRKAREIARPRIASSKRLGERLARYPTVALRGSRFGKRMDVAHPAISTPQGRSNALEEYFDSNTEGPGIWKWRHYFDIYDHHLAKFVGKRVNIVEIGIFSGGSLGMWRNYFGDGVRIYGVDIEPACAVYQDGPVRVFIGDQADPKFWERFCEEVQDIDVVIDDGGHESHQQIATLEALLPRMRPGGVFLCEDLIGTSNLFHRYVCGLSSGLNARGSEPNTVQRAVKSVSLYPYVTVIERRTKPLTELVAPRHGTEWQPFFDHLSLELPHAESGPLSSKH